MYLCVDYGSRYVGLAATDIDGRITYRYGTVDQKQQALLPRLREIIDKERIATVVVGVPLSLEGNETDQTRTIKAFIVSLKEFLGDTPQVVTVDETLTSVEAASRIKQEGGKKEDEHAEAARIMLDDFLRSKE